MAVKLLKGPSIEGVVIYDQLFTRDEALALAAEIVSVTDGHLIRRSNSEHSVEWNTESAFHTKYKELFFA